MQNKRELTELFQEFCRRCEHVNDKMSVDTDSCSQDCKWYKMMNKVIGEF